MASRIGQGAVVVLEKLQPIYKISEGLEFELPKLALILHPFNVTAMSSKEWQNFCFEIKNY